MRYAIGLAAFFLMPIVTFEVLQQIDTYFRGHHRFLPSAIFYFGFISLIVVIGLGLPLLMVLHNASKKSLYAHALGAALVGTIPPLGLFLCLAIFGDSSTPPARFGEVMRDLLLLPLVAPRFLGDPMLMGMAAGTAYWLVVRPDRNR